MRIACSTRKDLDMACVDGSPSLAPVGSAGWSRPPRPRSAPPSAGRVHRQRRPSGEPPPLPRPSGSTRWWWALVGVVLLGVAIEVWVANSDQPHAFGDAVLRAFEDVRTPVLTDIATSIAMLTAFGAVQLLRVVLAGVLIVTKRFRHLVVALAHVRGQRLAGPDLPRCAAPPRRRRSPDRRDRLPVPVVADDRLRDHGVRDAVRAGPGRPGEEAGDDRGVDRGGPGRRSRGCISRRTTRRTSPTRRSSAGCCPRRCSDGSFPTSRSP